MRVLEPLVTVITAEGELKRGKVEVDGQILRLDCATDHSWISLHDDSMGDPLAYDVLARENGILRSEQPTLTFAWTPEHFAWLRDYLDPPTPPEEEPPPEPLLFIRRPAQGFVPTSDATPPLPPPTPLRQPQVNEQMRALYLGLIYLVVGLLCWNNAYSLVQFMGGLFLIAAIRMLYAGRTLAKDLCLMIYGKLKQRL
jgi:hypothetical protein